MAVQINLYSFKKKRNSTAIPSDSGTVTNCALKSSTSVTAPVIELDLGRAFNPVPFNYARISAFERYYYITDWQYVNGLWIAYLQVDVLASFKDEIGASTQYIARSSALYDGTIIDSLYPADTQTSVITTTATAKWMTTLNNGFYVLGVVGAGGVSYYALSPFSFYQLTTMLFNEGTYDIGAEIQKEIFNPFQYIVSVKWFPITTGLIPDGENVTTIPFGWWSAEIYARKLNASMVCTWNVSVSIPKHPQTTERGNYVNCAPYTQLQMEFQPFGTIPLNTPVYCNYSTVYAVCKTDLLSGVGTAWISPTNSQNDATNVVTSMVGVPIQISQLNTHPVSTVVNLASAAAQAGIGIAGAVASGGATAVSGVVGAAAGVMNAVMSAMPQVQSSGSNGAFSIYSEPIRLVGTFHHLVTDDLSDRGRPLCQIHQISTLAGYIQCDDAHLSISGYPSELDAITSEMLRGFYYE